MKGSFVELAQLFVCTEGITGRKKLQKIVHILQSCGVNFGFDFRLALYGAYSTDLRCQVEELVACDLVQETPDQATGFPTSKFVAMEKLKQALELLIESMTPEWAALAQSLNQKSSRDLEGISTVIYLRNNGLTGEALQKQFVAIKPHLEADFSAAEAFAVELLPA